jgi:hypothetical protein
LNNSIFIFKNFQVISENFSKASDSNYKVFILQRIHYKIWQTTKNINKHLAWPIIGAVVFFSVVLLQHGRAIAVKAAKGTFSWTQVPLALVPLNGPLMLCFTCDCCVNIVSELRTHLWKVTSRKIRSTKLIEHYSMQLDMQPIEFQPINYFTFNFNFFVALICVILDNDIVFMQFYIG